MRFFKSFKYAFRGIVYCINNERNMRIHTAAALYVFAFSHFFEITRTGYAVLLLTFALVMAAELFNTVAEEITDMIAASYHPVARIIKALKALEIVERDGSSLYITDVPGMEIPACRYAHCTKEEQST